jgi:alpha-ketoglutarate-dependent taurine dioxygenase
VRFNNWLRGALDVPEERVEPLYRALCRFWRLLREPRFQIRLKLNAGEMLSFDNAPSAARARGIRSRQRAPTPAGLLSRP